MERSGWHTTAFDGRNVGGTEQFPPGHSPGLHGVKCRNFAVFEPFSFPATVRLVGKNLNKTKGFLVEPGQTKPYGNDIWKLGCTSASGAIVSTIIAATASVRKVTARRSTMIAISTTAVMKNERCVATSAPDSNR